MNEMTFTRESVAVTDMQCTMHRDFFVRKFQNYVESEAHEMHGLDVQRDAVETNCDVARPRGD